MDPILFSAAAEKKTAKKPAAKKPAVKKPAAKKPAAKKLVAKKPAAKKPATDKPLVKKKRTPKPAAKRPAVERPVGSPEEEEKENGYTEAEIAELRQAMQAQTLGPDAELDRKLKENDRRRREAIKGGPSWMAEFGPGGTRSDEADVNGEDLDAEVSEDY